MYNHAEKGAVMKIAVVGAGAMGGSFGGLLADSGQDVSLIDTWEEHVAAIRRDGLLIDEALGEHRVHLPAATEIAPGQTADLVIVFTDANNTAAGAETAARLLGNGGYAITFQNGIGNVEALQAALGRDRVLGGSSMCSAASRGPGHVSLTHLRPTSVGPLGDGPDAPVDAIVEALNGAGLTAQRVADAMPVIWEKFVLNCGVNALTATTGLRTGEMVRRVPEMVDFHVLAEVMWSALPNPDGHATSTGRRSDEMGPRRIQRPLLREANPRYNEFAIRPVQAVHGPEIETPGRRGSTPVRTTKTL